MLWGLKTVATFDVWAFEHMLSGLSVGTAAKIFSKKTFKTASPFKSTVIRFELLAVLLAAYAWEALEHYLETGLLGSAVEHWFQGVEFGANRLIADPLMLVVGYYIVKKYPFLAIPARIISVLWLFLHIFILPHSMYLHYLF